ncbi:MAG: LysR substrate-binding domain-containing protein [Pseudomonadota bacterium]
MEATSVRPREHSATPPKRQDMPPFESLRVFDVVGRLGGIRKAAQWLERDHAVVSRHLRALETWLGIQLIERKTSGTYLTEDGKHFHATVALAMDSISHGTLDLLNKGQHKSLTIYCTPGFALHWLSGQLEAFEAKNSDIDIVLKPSVDSPDFLSHEADVDIQLHATYEDEPQSPPQVRKAAVAKVPIFAVASPTYLSDNETIESPADLLSHNLLHEGDYETWGNWLRTYGVSDFGKLRGPRLSQGDLTLEAARQGRGIALTNQLTARPHLMRGNLVQVGIDSSSFPHRFGEYTVRMRQDRWNDRVPRRFRQWLQRQITRDIEELKDK